MKPITATHIEAAELDARLNPDPTAWRKTHRTRFALMGTPLGMQPSAAIRTAWRDREIGAVSHVDVAAAHDGDRLVFLLEWDDADENRAVGENDQFSDAAAIVLPAAADVPMITMGAPGAAVNAWYWSAVEDPRGRDVVAEGIGTSRTVDARSVTARGVWKSGRWRVVIARSLRVEPSETRAQLAPGEETGLGIAIWEGGHAERAGVKAFSGNWRVLALEPAPKAGRG